MNNAQNNITHRVFPSTYLQKVVFRVTFKTMSEENFPALSDLLREKVGIDFTVERLAAIDAERPLYFGTDDHTVEWIINSDRLEISVNRIYRSFEYTLKPLVEIVQSILDTVKRKASFIYLEKINLIPVTLSTYDEMETNASEVLSESVLSHWKDEYFQKDNSTLLYLTKVENVNDMEIDYISGFITKNSPEEDQPSRYILDITARYANVGDITSISDLTAFMNQRVFEVFIQSVTTGIIKSMERN